MNFWRFTKLFALGLMCCLTMAACSKDDEEKKPVPEEEKDPYYELNCLDTQFYVIPNQELREIADITCEVVDYNGNKKTYDLSKNNIIHVTVDAYQPDIPDLFGGMTRAPWINLPVTAKATVKFAFKEGFTPDPEREYNISMQIDGMMTAYNSFNNVLSEETSLFKKEDTFSAESLAEWAEATFPYEFGFKCEFVNNKFKVTKLN